MSILAFFAYTDNFFTDPDNYWIEVIQNEAHGKPPGDY